MKLYFSVTNILLLIIIIKITKEDICPENKIGISALGKCKNITDFLEGKDLKLKGVNLFYLSSNNKGRIEKDGYKLEIYKLNDTKLQSHNVRKSKLYIPISCLEKMEKSNKIKLDKNKGIVIIVHDMNNLNESNIPNNYFIILHFNKNSNIKYINSKNYDFSFCNEDPILLDDKINIDNLTYSNDRINMTKILYGRKFGIDFFDPYSDFWKDICIKFTSEKGTDVPLESRFEDYYQNISFCNDKENSHYVSFNYSANTGILSYRCAFGFFKSESDKSSYLDDIDKELKALASVSNIKVIKCYNNFLHLRDFIRNYGGMICIIVLIYQIICFLIFCFCGINPIKKKLKDLFLLGKKIVRRLSKIQGFNLNLVKEPGNININNKKKNKKLFNLWGQIKPLKEKNLLKPPRKQKIKGLKIKVSNSKNKQNSFVSDKNNSKESEEIKINITKINDDILKNELNNKKANDPIYQKTSGDIIEDEKVIPFQKEPKNNKSKKENIIDNKSENSQLYDYEIDELNELPYEKAIKYDKRNFCIYYGNILLSSHIILNVFFLYNDYNLFTVKLGLLLMTFPINLAFNTLFYTNKNIKLNYIKSMNDVYSFWNNISNSFYSSLLGDTLLIILKCISLTHNSVRSLRKMRNVDQAEEKSVCILKCIKIRILIYYVLTFIFLIVFGYYILCFCAVFENTQIELVKSTINSWLISLLYPFIICFLTSFFRTLALKKRNKCLYAIKQIMEFF